MKKPVMCKKKRIISYIIEARILFVNLFELTAENFYLHFDDI